MSCSTSSHSALKLSPAWAALPLIGVQHTPADETGPEELLELRNCSCGSTLAVVIGGAE